MQKLSSLAEMRAEYVNGRIGRKMLEGLIFQYLLDNFERFHLFRGEKDKWADFLAWLYPRMSRAIDYYKDRGATFDTYINAIIQWSSKEYKTRETEHRATEFVCWKAKAEEMQVSSPEPEYTVCSPDDRVTENKTENKFDISKTTISQRQILLLALKSYYFITDDLLNKIAKRVGINKCEIQNMIDKLHLIRAKREAYINDLKNRIHCQYYRCLAYEKRLSSSYPGTAKHEKLTMYVDRARNRFTAMRKRLCQIRMGATNQQIASLLNIPKGTVDSALHNARERWKTGYVRINHSTRRRSTKLSRLNSA